MSDDNALCLFCGSLLTFPETELLDAVKVLKIEIQDRYGLKTVIEGPMFCCFKCHDKLHDNLSLNAQLDPPGLKFQG
jgi:hypothetical protein